MLVMNFLQLCILLLQPHQSLLVSLNLVLSLIHPLVVAVLRECLLEVVKLAFDLLVSHRLLLVFVLLFIEDLISVQINSLIDLIFLCRHCLLFERHDTGH